MASVWISYRPFLPPRCGLKGPSRKDAKQRSYKTKTKTKTNVAESASKKLQQIPVKPPISEATCYTCLPVREEFASLYSNHPNHSLKEVTLSEWFHTGSIDNEQRTDQSINREDLDWSSVEASDGENDFHRDRPEAPRAEEQADEDQGEMDNSLEDVDTENLLKKKGVPAVMRCFDRAKIYAKAGSGGDGVVAFLREKFLPEGGPSGGNGGPGGNVYVEVDEDMNSLLPFRNKSHFRAGKGDNGQGKKQNGAAGEDALVKVAPGTVIKEVDKNGDPGDVLAEMMHPGERVLLVPGGKGGRGNASFRSSMNKLPRIAENGEEGIEMWLELELKLVADVGIIGVPNAGKSTLLSAISAAQPNIASYPYTTLLPNLGVVEFDYGATLVVADLPGLLEGAHRGFGLGHEFLRHIERCCVLVHVIDGSSPQPDYEFDAVRLELEMFNPELSEKPYVVAYNKMDLPEAYEKWISFRDTLKARGIDSFSMSALNVDGTYRVIQAAYQLFQKVKADKRFEGTRPPEYVVDLKNRQQPSSVKDFAISHDSVSNTWQVTGAGLERFVQMTNWRYVDSELRFQHVLEASGLSRALVKQGVKEGDTVKIGDMKMVWHDDKDGSRSSTVLRRTPYSTT